MNYKHIFWWLLASGLILVDVLGLQSLHPAAPSLLVPLLIYTVHSEQPGGMVLALWLGVLLDMATVGPFGVFMLISLGMLLLVRWVYGQGVEVGRWLNLLWLGGLLLGWQYLVWAIVGILDGSYVLAVVPLLVLWFVVQLLLTVAVSFVFLRLVRL